MARDDYDDDLHDDEDDSAPPPAEGGFLSSIQDTFGSAPWWVISTIIHAVILALLTLLIFTMEQIRSDEVLITTDLQEEKQEEKKKEQRDVFKSEKTVDFVDQVENPVFTHDEVVVTDHFETENEMDMQTAKGHEEAISDVPMGGVGVVGTIGVGGGRGGAFGHRNGGGRKKSVGRFGGSRKSESAVDHALEWLARHQEPNGSWAIQKHEGTFDEQGHIAISGLATLAFLGAGHTEKTGKFKNTVKKAVAYLISQQDAQGQIGNNQGHRTGGGYNHACAGLALAEAFGMAKVPRTGKAAQLAIHWTCDKHQVEYSGWRYSAKSQPDTSVTGWFIMHIKSGKVSGLQVPGESFQGAINWLDKVEVKGNGDDGYGGGRFAYMPGRNPTKRMAAIGVLGRLFLGWPPNQLMGGADMLRQSLPNWNQKDFYYWYYGTLCMFQMGGDFWKAWNGAMRDMLVNNQRKGGDEDGSWDPQGGSYARAGRVWSTAVGALCLEVYYRYLPIYKK